VPFWISQTKLCSVFLFTLSEFFFYPLLGRARYRGRCWAAIRLFHRPEPPGHAVHGEVDGLDIGRRHGRRFVLQRHTHRPQRRPYPICTSRSGGVMPDPGSSWECHSVCVCIRCLELMCRVLCSCPPTAPHICCCQIDWWVAVQQVQMGVSVWGAVQQHSMDRWVEQMSRLHGTAS